MKIRCKVCANTDGTICKIKNVKVAQNKSRYCDLFDYAPEKVKPVQQMEAIYVPYNIRTRKEYKKTLKEETRKAVVKAVSQNLAPDCLANFRANVTD